MLAKEMREGSTRAEELGLNDAKSHSMTQLFKTKLPFLNWVMKVFV